MSLSTLYIPVLILKARKFALLFSLGSLFFIMRYIFASNVIEIKIGSGLNNFFFHFLCALQFLFPQRIPSIFPTSLFQITAHIIRIVCGQSGSHNIFCDVVTEHGSHRIICGGSSHYIAIDGLG